MSAVMDGGCAFAALIRGTAALLLLLLTALNVPAAHSTDSTERCVYINRLNQNQSRDIVCSSLPLHGSTYYHKLDSDHDRNDNQLDMIHCEAISTRYSYLDLYDHAAQDGIVKSLLSSGACVISGHGVNCTRAILFINVTYYDQHNGSVLPVCAFRNSDHNLECFCIHYLTLERAPEMVKCQPVTTDGMTNNATTTESDTEFNNHTQPTDGCPAVVGAQSGRFPAATFQGTVSVLVIVIALQAIVIIIMIVAVCKRKLKNRTLFSKPKATSDKVKYARSSSLTVQRIRTDDARQSVSDDEHENEHDIFGVHEERHTLLRSKSCPAGSPTADNPEEFNY